MLVRRFCKCGVKLERHVADEETARRVVATFWRDHSGAAHGIIDSKQYATIIAGIMRRNYDAKHKPALHGTNQLGLRTFRRIK